MPPSTTTLGLIAGQGELPVLVARGMRDAGVRVCGLGLGGDVDPALPALCDEYHVVGLIRLGQWIRRLRHADVREAIMVGRVAKARMHDPRKLWRQLPDWRAIVIWYRRLRHDRRNAAVLAAVADALQENGITLIDSTTYIPDHLAEPGPMGRIELTAAQRADVEFGWPLLEQLLELDIGQSIAVRDRDVIAVEAVEGTDRLIARAGELCPAKGWTLLKSARSDHDKRTDVPTIGVDTIARLAEAGAGAIAVGAGRVILLDRDRVIAAADRARVCVFGV